MITSLLNRSVPLLPFWVVRHLVARFYRVDPGDVLLRRTDAGKIEAQLWSPTSLYMTLVKVER